VNLPPCQFTPTTSSRLPTGSGLELAPDERFRKVVVAPMIAFVATPVKSKELEEFGLFPM